MITYALALILSQRTKSQAIVRDENDRRGFFRAFVLRGEVAGSLGKDVLSHRQESEFGRTTRSFDFGDERSPALANNRLEISEQHK